MLIKYRLYKLMVVIACLRFVSALVDRSGEIFRRISRKRLHTFLLGAEQGDESVFHLAHDIADDDETASQSTTMSQQSGHTGTIISTHQAGIAERGEQHESHFLLLDVRDEDAYKKCHIEGGESKRRSQREVIEVCCCNDLHGVSPLLS